MSRRVTVLASRAIPYGIVGARPWHQVWMQRRNSQHPLDSFVALGQGGTLATAIGDAARHLAAQSRGR